MYGAEFNRLNAGLMLVRSAEGRGYPQCLDQGTAWLRDHLDGFRYDLGELRITDDYDLGELRTTGDYGRDQTAEQSVLNWLCGAARSAEHTDERIAGGPTAPCAMRCSAWPARLYMTGCAAQTSSTVTARTAEGEPADSNGARYPTALFHYNCNATYFKKEREEAARASSAEMLDVASASPLPAPGAGG